jgi:hypothetical protein
LDLVSLCNRNIPFNYIKIYKGVDMPHDITVIIDDLPGSLANVGKALGAAGINIEGYCSIVFGGKSYLHILVQDPNSSRDALEKIGLQVSQQREVLTVDMDDEPGALGKVAGKIAAAGVNIDMVYMATRSRLVVIAYDLERARAAL